VAGIGLFNRIHGKGANGVREIAMVNVGALGSVHVGLENRRARASTPIADDVRLAAQDAAGPQNRQPQRASPVVIAGRGAASHRRQRAAIARLLVAWLTQGFFRPYDPGYQTQSLSACL
jgi:hypothetical protein